MLNWNSIIFIMMIKNNKFIIIIIK